MPESHLARLARAESDASTPMDLAVAEARYRLLKVAAAFGINPDTTRGVVPLPDRP